MDFDRLEMGAGSKSGVFVMLGQIFNQLQGMGQGQGGEDGQRRAMLVQQLMGDNPKAQTAMKAIGMSLMPLMMGLSMARAQKRGEEPWWTNQDNRQQVRDWRQARPDMQGVPQGDRRDVYQQWRDQRPAFLPDFRPFWDKR